MMKNITIGQYIPGESIVHQLDPRTKILATFLFIALLFLVETFTGYALGALMLFVIVLLSRIPVKFVLRGIRPLMFIIVLTLCLHFFMTEGRVILQIWFLKLTYEGLIRGLMMVSRLILLIIGSSLLTLTTSPILLTDGIESLLKPFRAVGVPAHELAMMMTIALRFIPTLVEETEKIMKAQMARGADFESGNIFHRAKSLIPILIPLFVSAFRRADELAVAMEARGYRGGEGRTRFRVLKFTRRDAAALILVAGLVILVGFCF
ncbi:MAG: energy-coupling factor transporter transmembrane component T [Limnochordia bacterium]|nr:energy-coupling factor transporter transmembrane component T [Bacillota bacterium]NLH31833.1 energy-coupling factor transporter transmembrane protein EcfT [Bacillota bacterium]HPT92945.1 energy-coupling factor transporter transmembrane component T [Limnochordia bacterium]HXK97133.1 energy-coupling factor transporter transmembrane component T [Limnochordia bacterium]